MIRFYKKGGNWYFIGTRYQGSHPNINVLINQAKQAGE